MNRLAALFLIIAVSMPFVRLLAQSGMIQPGCIAQTEIRDVVGPATQDLVARVVEMSTDRNCSAILLLINTPGGSLETTRNLVSTILNSPIPFLCLVAPSGGHAGSAGAILLQACHVSGALHGTNLGAATPVSVGQEMPKDLRQKILNDTRSWLEGLTGLRGRNEEFGRQIILDAKAVSAEEAVKLKGIDFVGYSVEEFLKFADGREVKMRENQKTQVTLGNIEVFKLDFRYKTLSLLTDPELAYTLFLGSLALLYFEITHPGVYLPGVVGAMGLVVSLLSLNRLEVEWAGLLLLVLGVIMLIAELFLPTMGVLGIGGAVCLFLGSTFLFDPAKTGGYQLPNTLIFPVVIFFVLMVVGINALYLKTRRVKKKGGFEDLLEKSGRIVRVDQEGVLTIGLVEVQGETWKFESNQNLKPQDQVTVTGHQGLVLKVNRS